MAEFERELHEPVDKKNHPLVTFEDDHAIVRFKHSRVTTAEDAALRQIIHQQRLSQQVGKVIPLDEIRVWPEAGDAYQAETLFSVKPGQEDLYPGLWLIHQESPNVLSGLIAGLTQFSGTQQLTEKQAALVSQTITGLRAIIEPVAEPER